MTEMRSTDSPAGRHELVLQHRNPDRSGVGVGLGSLIGNIAGCLLMAVFGAGLLLILVGGAVLVLLAGLHEILILTGLIVDDASGGRVIDVWCVLAGAGNLWMLVWFAVRAAGSRSTTVRADRGSPDRSRADS